MFIVSIKYTFFFNNIKHSLQLYDIPMAIIFNFLYLFDVLLNFNTGYYEKDILVVNKNKISLHYLKGDFIKSSVA